MAKKKGGNRNNNNSGNRNPNSSQNKGQSSNAAKTASSVLPDSAETAETKAAEAAVAAEEKTLAENGTKGGEKSAKKEAVKEKGGKKAAASGKDGKGDEPRLNVFQKIGKYFNDLKAEFKKVVWPPGKQVFQHTTAVVISCIIVGAFVFLIDLAFTKLFEIALIK